MKYLDYEIVEQATEQVKIIITKQDVVSETHSEGPHFINLHTKKINNRTCYLRSAWAPSSECYLEKGVYYLWGRDNHRNNNAFFLDNEQFLIFTIMVNEYNFKRNYEKKINKI